MFSLTPSPKHTHTITYFPLPTKTYKEIIPHKHLRLTERPSLKSLQIINIGEGVEKKEALLHCWGKCKLVQPLWKTVWRFLENLKLWYDPAISLLGIYPDKTIIQKDTCILMFIAAPFMIAKTWKQSKCPPPNVWIKNMRYINTMEYYSAIKKNEIMPSAATWIDQEIIILSEVSQK